MTRSASRHCVRTAAILLVAVVALAGCAEQDRPGFTLQGFIADLLPQSPQEVLAESVESPDLDQRRRSIMEMANWDDANEGLVTLVGMTLMTERDTMTRAQAAQTLGMWGDRRGALFLAVALTGMPPQEKIELKTDVLSTMPNLPDRSKFVRMEAAYALGKLDPAVSVGPLATSLQTDPDLDVRMAAAHALGRHQSEDAVQAVLIGMVDDDLAVRVAALDSLRYMTGQDFGRDVEAWLNYLNSAEQPLADYGESPVEPHRTESSVWQVFSDERKAKIREIFNDLFPLERREGPFD